MAKRLDLLRGISQLINFQARKINGNYHEKSNCFSHVKIMVISWAFGIDFFLPRAGREIGHIGPGNFVTIEYDPAGRRKDNVMSH